MTSSNYLCYSISFNRSLLLSGILIIQFLAIVSSWKIGTQVEIVQHCLGFVLSAVSRLIWFLSCYVCLWLAHLQPFGNSASVSLDGCSTSHFENVSLIIMSWSIFWKQWGSSLMPYSSHFIHPCLSIVLSFVAFVCMCGSFPACFALCTWIWRLSVMYLSVILSVCAQWKCPFIIKHSFHLAALQQSLHKQS